MRGSTPPMVSSRTSARVVRAEHSPAHACKRQSGYVLAFPSAGKFPQSRKYSRSARRLRSGNFRTSAAAAAIADGSPPRRAGTAGVRCRSLSISGRRASASARHNLALVGRRLDGASDGAEVGARGVRATVCWSGICKCSALEALRVAASNCGPFLFQARMRRVGAVSMILTNRPSPRGWDNWD